MVSKFVAHVNTVDWVMLTPCNIRKIFTYIWCTICLVFISQFGGSVLLVLVAVPIVYWGFVFGPCFVMPVALLKLCSCYGVSVSVLYQFRWSGICDCDFLGHILSKKSHNHRLHLFF